MVEQFCSECGKMLAEHEGLRCDACIAKEREELEAEKQKAIDNFRESLLEAMLHKKNEPHIITPGGLLQNRYIQLDVVTHLIRTHRKE